MGWYYEDGINRKQLVAQRIASWQHETKDGVVIHSTCIAHCYRGNPYRGVLWTVWERTFEKTGVSTQPTERWIGCDLLQYDAGAWGYKPMEESCHPYYYSCPLIYLELAPVANEEWRVGVRAYHERQREKREAKKLAT